MRYAALTLQLMLICQMDIRKTGQHGICLMVPKDVLGKAT